MYKRFLALISALVAVAFLGSTAPAQGVPTAKVAAGTTSAALPHWSPWVLCNTAGHDYQLRVHVTPIGGDWWPNAIETRRAVGSAKPPAYDYVWMEYYNSAGTLIADNGYSVSRRDTAAKWSVFTTEWAGARRPQVRFVMFDINGDWDNAIRRCTTQRVAVG